MALEMQHRVEKEGPGSAPATAEASKSALPSHKRTRSRGYSNSVAPLQLHKIRREGEDALRAVAQFFSPTPGKNGGCNIAVSTSVECKSAPVLAEPRLLASSHEVVCVEGELSVAQTALCDDAIVSHDLGRLSMRLVTQNQCLYIRSSPNSDHQVEVKLDQLSKVNKKGDELTLEVSSGCTRLQSKGTKYTFHFPERVSYLAWADHIERRLRRANEGRESSSKDPAHDVLPSRTPSKRVVESFVYPPLHRTIHILLVRHGHYINAHERNAVDADQVLSQLGRQQAGFTAKYLEQLFHRSPTRHDLTIFHSDLSRAVETAKIIGDDIGSCEFRVSRLLREGWPGEPFRADEQESMQGASKYKYPSEMQQQVLDRMQRAYDQFFSIVDDEDVGQFRLVVSHANLIRYFICRALKMMPQGVWGHFEINHCSVTRIDICEGQPTKIVAINETGHLPHSFITSSEDHL